MDGNPYQSNYQAAGTGTSIKERRKRLSWMMLFAAISAIGLFVCFAGFFYAVVFVGIPDQDPTPQMLQRQSFHERLSGTVVLVGVVALLGGIVGFVMSAFTRLIRGS